MRVRSSWWPRLLGSVEDDSQIAEISPRRLVVELFPEGESQEIDYDDARTEVRF
jgi:hypothetical protein